MALMLRPLTRPPSPGPSCILWPPSPDAGVCGACPEAVQLGHAWARLRSTLLWTLLLICHFLRRSICELPVKGYPGPNASGPILADHSCEALSWTAKLRAPPTLLLVSYSVGVKALHSGRRS